MTRAQEVIGSLATYRGDGACPVCDSAVLEVTTTAEGEDAHRCISCDWFQPIQRGLSSDLKDMYSKKLLDRLLPNVVFAHFGRRSGKTVAMGDTVTVPVKFRRFNPAVKAA